MGNAPRLRRLALLIVSMSAPAFVGCSQERSTDGPVAAAGALRGRNVLLVTIDTLRADHVGAYGSPLGLTPTLDRFAREGWRFETAYAHVPLTLPSHATILTGLYPFHTGVRDNGSFHLNKATPTLAAALKSAGYRTGAFVGAFVLDARFGLNTGFDVYDDRMLGNSSTLEVVQRTAEQVLAPAAAWITQPSSLDPSPKPSALSPFFAWVHLYDPHEPYDPPEPYRTRYSQDSYSGEIAYADAALGRFFDTLQAAGALDRTLVVIASDHGESLGEHGERTHGLFAYNATLKVPLVVWARNAIEPKSVGRMAQLVDIAPGILDLVGAPALARTDGLSLASLANAATRAGDRRPSYFEALNANLTRDWAPLRGVFHGSMKLIDLPIPELYDVAVDPSETRNLYAAQRDQARTLEHELDQLGAGDRGSVTPAAVDAEAAARLRSLGYVVGSGPKRARKYMPADDPKRLVHLNTALDDAAGLWARGDGAAAIRTLQAVVTERPDLTIAYERLAFMLRATGAARDAVTLLDRAARGGHADPPLLRALGAALADTGDLPRSASILEALVKRDASDFESADALGQTYARMRRPRDAEAQFRRVLETSPNAATTWTNLGVLYLGERRDADAAGALERAVRINPALAGAHNALGAAYARQGNVTRAVEEWKEALRLRPDLEDARANLRKIESK